MINSIEEIKRKRAESDRIVKGRYNPVTLKLTDIDFLLERIEVEVELRKAAYKRIHELETWAQQVTDAIDGRPLPSHPDSTPERIATLRATQLCECGHNRERHEIGYCNIQYDPCKCKGRFTVAE